MDEILARLECLRAAEQHHLHSGDSETILKTARKFADFVLGEEKSKDAKEKASGVRAFDDEGREL